MRAYSVRSFAYCPETMRGWRARCPSNVVAAPSTSLRRIPISGLTASALYAARSISASRAASRRTRGAAIPFVCERTDAFEVRFGRDRAVARGVVDFWLLLAVRCVVVTWLAL